MKNIRLLVFVTLASALLGVVLVAQKRQSQRAKPAPAKPATTNGVLRQPDPNRAPQTLVDQALFAEQPFFDQRVAIPRPYAEALREVSSLVARFPKDPALRLHATRLSERVGHFDDAVKEMEEYARLRNFSEDALRRLAAFYHHRAKYTDEVGTLQRLAKASPVADRAPIYRRVISLINDHQLKIPAERVYEEMIAGDPENFELVKGYVETLAASKHFSRAFQVLDTYEPKYEQQLRFFLHERAQAFEAQNNRAGAIDAYSRRFDPVWPRGVAADFYELLRRYGKYRDYRRELQSKVREGSTDFEVVSRLFNVYAYESNIPYAARILAQYEERKTGEARASGTTLPAQELEQIAEMYSTVGYYDQASRYLYTLYLNGTLGPQSKGREDALARLFQALIDSGNTPTRIGAGDLKFYRDVATVDQNPGLLNGILSLILSDTRPSEEFHQEEARAAGYFNRAFAYRIFTSYKQEFPASPRLAHMYLGMLDAFAGFGEPQGAVELGKEFQAKFPKAPEYAAVSLKTADSLVALKQRVSERSVLANLLDHIAAGMPASVPLLPVSSNRWRYSPTAGGGGQAQPEEYEQRYSYAVFDPTESSNVGSDYSPYAPPEYDYAGREVTPARLISYSQVLERIVASYAADKKQAETLRFFWGEIKKHPKEEGLYERFLKWLGQTSLIEEQLKAYTAAINQYDSETWYDRLARWYLRQKRTRAFLAYSKELLGVFSDDEARVYVNHFSSIASSLSGDYDRALTFELYRMAHDRFPQNIEFVKGLLEYYAGSKQWGAWQGLLTQYYFADRQFRDALLFQYANLNQLRAKVDEARTHRDQLAYKHFIADTSLWLSHFEDALDTYRELAKLYPGETAYVERLADLTRSLDWKSDSLGTESAKAWSELAEIYPTIRAYRTKAGETLAEMGNFAGARAEWDKLLESDRGSTDAYREVASIYWDYFQWDDAIRVIKELRETIKQPSALAYERGALYEGKNDWNKAIGEYVATLGEGSADEAKAIKRLVQLAPRRNYRDLIAGAFQSCLASAGERGPRVRVYARYLSDANRGEESYALLRGEVAKSTDVSFLESARDVFHANALVADEQRTLGRLVEAGRDVREQMQYRLQLAAFFEATDNTSQATHVYDGLATEFPTNLGVIQETSSYYKRAGLFDKAIGLYQRSIGKSRGSYQRDFTLALADRQADAKRLANAETTLRDLYAKDPLDTTAFGKLVRVLGDEGKDDALVELYRSGLDQIRKAGLDRDSETNRLAQLRLGMVSTFARLNKPSEAVDQYIEIINRQPEDAELLARAIAFSRRNGQLERMLKYYQDTSARSFKDYRWNLVLARMAEDRGDYAEAGAQYEKAVLNEPQRMDFRSSLADSLIRAGKPDGAITELHKASALDNGNTTWLMRIALIQVQQGKRADAVATLRTAMASRKNIVAKTIFDYAASLRSWGLLKEALEFYHEGFNRYFTNPYEQTLPPEAVAGFIDASIKNEPMLKTAQSLEAMLARLRTESEKETNYEKYKIDAAKNAISEAIEKVFAKQLAAFGSGEEQRPLADYYKQQIVRIPDYTEDSQKELRRYATLAHSALLPDVEEAAFTRLTQVSLERYSNGARQVTSASQSSTGAEAVSPSSRFDRQRPLPPGAYSANPISVDAQHYYQEVFHLLDFYDSRAAFDRSARFLEASYQRDLIKDKFDYFGELAWYYELLGQTDQELAALRKFYSLQTGSLTQNESPTITRYLELLYQSSFKETRPVGFQAAANELRELATHYNPYQLQLINFLINHREEALALEAIANAKMPPGWVASRSGQVALFFRDQTSRAEGFFKIALDVRTIGDFIKSPNPPAGQLSQHDWYWAARSYGMWLRLSDARAAEGRRYLPGLIERRPRDSEAQLYLANYYLDSKQTRLAADHAALAEELAPSSARVLATKGAVLYASGKTSEAVAAWQAIADRKGAAAAGVQLYFEMMRQHKLIRQSLPVIERYLLRAIPRANSFELMKPFIREVVYSAYSDEPQQIYKVAQTLGAWEVSSGNADPLTLSAIQAMLRSLTDKLPEQLLLPEMVLNERLVPDGPRGDFYRMVIARQERKVLALSSSGTDTASYSEWSGSEYIPPGQSLDRWRAEYINYLIDKKSFAEARTELARVRAAVAARRKDNYAEVQTAGVEGETSGQPQVEDWMTLSEGRLAVREGRVEEASRALRRYAGIGIAASEAGVAPPPNKQRAVAAYALLRREGQTAAATELMREAYSQLLAAGQHEDANFAGLAEIEFKRGDGRAALAQLKRMVDEKIGAANTLTLAAATASRYLAFDAALDYRQRALNLNREDAENWLEMSRLLAALNRRAEAGEGIRKLVNDRATPNTAKAAAAFAIPEVVKGDIALAGKLAEIYRSPGAVANSYSDLILAQLLEITGHASDAESLMRSSASRPQSAFANVLLGAYELSRGDRPAAAAALESALYQDPGAVVTHMTAFAAGLPRDLLIKMYSAGGRESAALELAKQSPYYRLTEGPSDDEGGVIYSEYQEGSILSSQPDGWFVELYLYPLYTPPPSSLFKIPPGHGPLQTADSALQADEASAAKFRTLAELNLDASLEGRKATLRVLSQVAARVGAFQDAVDYERARRPILVSAEAITESNRYLLSLLGKQHEEEKRLLARVKVDKSFTDESAPGTAATQQ